VTELKAAITRACASFDRYGIKHSPSPPAKRTAAEAFTVLPSSDELATLYAMTLRSDIVFGWYAEDVTVYAVSNLLPRQERYRWAVGKRDKLLPGRGPDWVVIGDVMGGDPIIAAPKERGTPVYWAMHGTGEWKPVRVAASLAQGAEALVAWLDVFRGTYGGRSRTRTTCPCRKASRRPSRGWRGSSAPRRQPAGSRPDPHERRRRLSPCPELCRETWSLRYGHPDGTVAVDMLPDRHPVVPRLRRTHASRGARDRPEVDPGSCT
jgi:hypothetical protein